MNIVSGGLACLDIIKDKNKDIIMLGGTSANVVSILSILGANCSFLYARYNNKRDEQLSMEFNKRKINIIEFVNSSKPIPRIIERIENGKHRFEISCPLCNRKLCDVILPTDKQIDKLDVIESGDTFYFDRISSGIKKLIALNRRGWNIYEPNSVRQYDVLLKNFEMVNIVKISSDRIPKKYIEKMIEDLDNSEVQLVIVSLGIEGLKFSLRLNSKLSEWNYLKSYKANNIKDTSGAGDWLTATFLFLFLKKYPLFEYNLDIAEISNDLTLAQQIAALSCSYLGAQGMLYSSNGVKIINQLMMSNIEKLEYETVSNFGCTYCWI